MSRNLAKKIPRKFALRAALSKPPPKDYLALEIPAGKATSGPPLGPQLGPLGINIAAFCKDFNSKTENYRPGVPLCCELNVNADRSYQIEIGHPTTQFLITQAAGVKTLSWSPETFKLGKITIKHLYEIAVLKQTDRLLKLTPLQKLLEDLVQETRSLGIEIVKELDPEEYKAYLEDKQKLVDEYYAALEAEKEDKLFRR